jgi:hypothetical protein
MIEARQAPKHIGIARGGDRSFTISAQSSQSLELSVKADEAGELEDGVEGLGGELAAPVPRAREAAVDARPGVVKVLGAAAVERRPEKVVQYVHAQLVQPAVPRVDHGLDAVILLAYSLHVLEAGNDGA